ncbi:hypothetical protein FOXG_22223 [Fusarium oxysporum f. sp. lycopersici 4287]|uniref:Uncharacterized protein n=1 Tax=Fusarium oxysporum f. sp. lycopersici (strain 4287 / CBS 123668 / FGSC 9935 / NRRL 34936) TaxID=426428 RepID=A0A0J9W544_FUSO4|nr:hypothetical protein FOXG_22095 [Fusarium oxysporum f. sp. lycopersici 4287]XP_018256453.1 uncharacterized protein FOXG_22223 [Fusarium oxysporum f. sp. lycopersici 4287]KNB17896.1 hypothetical protein FOXG_22095 [Fusarium oxysporum f. sp. lycopersici 4287]KNB18408.1 hypothetical protein FOXG_22223 [Fusarium oxysporum f. sp. lycopersici 4287]
MATITRPSLSESINSFRASDLEMPPETVRRDSIVFTTANVTLKRSSKSR